MADEINRASPRTQSALLQAMQEQHVTVAGARYDLAQAVSCIGDAKPIESTKAPIRSQKPSSIDF